jgi:hypothetical protein
VRCATVSIAGGNNPTGHDDREDGQVPGREVGVMVADDWQHRNAGSEFNALATEDMVELASGHECSACAALVDD